MVSSGFQVWIFSTSTPSAAFGPAGVFMTFTSEPVWFQSCNHGNNIDSVVSHIQSFGFYLMGAGFVD